MCAASAAGKSPQGENMVGSLAFGVVVSKLLSFAMFVNG